MRAAALALSLAVLGCAGAAPRRAVDSGYRGIGFSGSSKDPRHPFKHIGGLGLYPYQNVPVAVYSRAAGKTFFCWGGSPRGHPRRQVNMISYFDHATGRVPRPRILVDRGVEDGHDNPTMQIDDAGRILVFTNNRRDGRPAIVWRSRRPYDIDSLEKIDDDDFMYAQPWSVPGRGMRLLHTIRQPPDNPLFFRTSRDGEGFGAPRPFARIGMGG